MKTIPNAKFVRVHHQLIGKALNVNINTDIIYSYDVLNVIRSQVVATSTVLVLLLETIDPFR